MQNERKPIIGVMGGGRADADDEAIAVELGRRIARQGWFLLSGGRNAGIMEASAKGAKQAGGTTIGVLPDADVSRASRFIDIPIVTGMGHARNAINVLSSNVVVACSGGAGTVSEIALALKSGKPVILLGFELTPWLQPYAAAGHLFQAANPQEAIAQIEGILSKNQPSAIRQP